MDSPKRHDRTIAHARVRKRRRGWRRAGILWEFNGDGRFSHEWLSPWWTRYWRRYDRRVGQQALVRERCDPEEL